MPSDTRSAAPAGPNAAAASRSPNAAAASRSPHPAAALARALKEEALARGFSLAGITTPDPTAHAAFYRGWLERGLHGEMGYLAREDAVARRADLRGTMRSVASVLVVAHEYGDGEWARRGAAGDLSAHGLGSAALGRPASAAAVPTPAGAGTAGAAAVDPAPASDPAAADDPAPADSDLDPTLAPDPASLGVIARYARGRDYHKIVKAKLLGLLRWLDEQVEGGVQGRAYVDTGPLLERDLARRAGLGWFGRNTMLIHPRRGSYFFIGTLLLDLELPADEPFAEDRCGSCHACLDACPTGALLGRDESGAPVIDARRCISYLTIEHRGPIPRELRPAIGNRVYGCDICQEVCPFNVRFAAPAAEPAYAARGPAEAPFGVEPEPGPPSSHPGTSSPSLVELLETALDEAAWDALSRGSAIRRAGRAGFARNVCIALGNWGAPAAVPVLTSALSDGDPLVRAHAGWALGQIDSPEAREVLERALPSEEDPLVREELALSRRPSQGRTRQS